MPSDGIHACCSSICISATGRKFASTMSEIRNVTLIEASVMPRIRPSRSFGSSRSGSTVTAGRKMIQLKRESIGFPSLRTQPSERPQRQKHDQHETEKNHEGVGLHVAGLEEAQAVAPDLGEDADQIDEEVDDLDVHRPPE